RQVENGGGELVWIDQCWRGVQRQLRVDLNLLAERRPQQLDGFEHQRVDVDFPRLQGLFAGERQQVFGQARAAFGGVVDHLGYRRKLRVLRYGFGENADRAGNDGQAVVEVVGYPARQLTNGIHLLHLAELRLGGLFFGQVATYKEVTPDRFRPGTHPAQIHHMAILVDVAGLKVAHMMPAPGSAHLLARAFEIIGVNELDGAMADHFFRLIPENGHRTGTDLNESAVGVGNENQVLRRFEDPLALLDFLAESRLGRFAFADIARDLGGTDDLARIRPER